MNGDPHTHSSPQCLFQPPQIARLRRCRSRWCSSTWRSTWRSTTRRSSCSSCTGKERKKEEKELQSFNLITNYDDQVNALSESRMKVLWYVGKDTCPLWVVVSLLLRSWILYYTILSIFLSLSLFIQYVYHHTACCGTWRPCMPRAS